MPSSPCCCHLWKGLPSRPGTAIKHRRVPFVQAVCLAPFTTILVRVLIWQYSVTSSWSLVQFRRKGRFYQQLLLRMGCCCSYIIAYISLPIHILALFFPETCSWLFFLLITWWNPLHSNTFNCMPEVVEIHWKLGHSTICEVKSAKTTWAVKFTSSSLKYFAFEEEEKAGTALKQKLIREENDAVITKKNVVVRKSSWVWTFYAYISAFSRGYTACKGRSPLGRGRGGAGKDRGGERRPDGARQGAPRCRASAGRGWHSGTPRVLPPGRLLRGGGGTGAPQGRAKLSYGDALTLLNVYVFLRIQ